MSDWALGHYEWTAAELAPVAEHAVAIADVRSGRRVLDLVTPGIRSLHQHNPVA